MEEEILIEDTLGKIRIVRLNKPQRKNAISVELFERLTQILHESKKDSQVQQLVLTGTGDFFTSGFDIAASTSILRDATSFEHFFRVLAAFVQALVDFDKVLVAAVNGSAVGIGVTMLPLCDLTYSVEGTTFKTPFAKLGMVPEACASLTLPRY